MRLVAAFYFDSIASIVKSHLEYSLNELLAVLVLAEYYCHPNEFTNEISRVILVNYPGKIDVRAIHKDNLETAASWLSTRAMLIMVENMHSESDLDSVVALLIAEVVIPE